MELQNKPFLKKNEIASIFYHDIFDYPLSPEEVIMWRLGKKIPDYSKNKKIIKKGEFYFVEGKENLLYKKALRKKISQRKIKLAQKITLILAKIPTLLGVFITGNLAMNNADDQSDIDLMIITRSGSLWFTRLMCYLILGLTNSETRKYSDKNQRDKLCLNIWLDENTLIWSKNDRNIYTAHEIAQIKPIVNKKDIYGKFLSKNSWILDYWPNSVGIKNVSHKTETKSRIGLLERFCFWIQYRYMRKKITKEKVGYHYAIFHPNDLSSEVLKKLSS